jgi:AraC-like DNA-binding protein
MQLDYTFFYRNTFRPLASLSLHEVACVPCPKGYTRKIQKALSYSIYCVIAGKGVFALTGGGASFSFSLAAGDCFAVYPGMSVALSADAEDPWTLGCVSFDGTDARLLLSASGFEPKNPVIQPEQEIMTQIVGILSGIYTYRGEELYSLAQSTALLYTFMAFLIKSASMKHPSVTPGWIGTQRFQKAMDYISANYSHSITVNDIAQYVCISRSRLYRIFIEQIFISPQQYLTEFRIREACHLIEKPSGTIKEIAVAVGFNDPAYFSDVFKQITGKSPTQYKKDFEKYVIKNANKTCS